MDAFSTKILLNIGQKCEHFNYKTSQADTIKQMYWLLSWRTDYIDYIFPMVSHPMKIKAVFINHGNFDCCGGLHADFFCISCNCIKIKTLWMLVLCYMETYNTIQDPLGLNICSFELLISADHIAWLTRNSSEFINHNENDYWNTLWRGCVINRTIIVWAVQ